jgi:hypothetical protein
MILRSCPVHNSMSPLCHLVLFLFVPEESYGRKWRSQPVRCNASHIIIAKERLGSANFNKVRYVTGRVSRIDH